MWDIVNEYPINVEYYTQIKKELWQREKKI
jgi:hypothetical protein